jgi:hypothetical protein
MWTKNDWVELRLQLNERAVVFREGEPVRALGPGKHRIDRKLEELKPIFDTDIPLFEARPEVRAVLPAEWFREVTVGAHERAVLFREGRPVQALKPGIHRHWTVDPTVHIEVFPVAQPPPNDARVLNLLKDEVVQVLIGQHQRGLLFVEGRLARVLEPGRHLAWNTPESPATVSTVDMRHQTLNIQGQELMTQDKVSLRLSVIAEWSPKDPALVQRVAAASAAEKGSESGGLPRLSAAEAGPVGSLALVASHCVRPATGGTRASLCNRSLGCFEISQWGKRITFVACGFTICPNQARNVSCGCMYVARRAPSTRSMSAHVAKRFMFATPDALQCVKQAGFVARRLVHVAEG